MPNALVSYGWDSAEQRTLKVTARKAPVTITEYNRPRFVMMSYEIYLALTGSPPTRA